MAAGFKADVSRYDRGCIDEILATFRTGPGLHTIGDVRCVHGPSPIRNAARYLSGPVVLSHSECI